MQLLRALLEPLGIAVLDAAHPAFRAAADRFLRHALTAAAPVSEALSARTQAIVAAGYAAADVERVTRLIKVNEYKRRQSPVGIRITHRAFGRDWRYPITSKFRA